VGDNYLSEALGKLEKSYGSLLLLLHVKKKEFSTVIAGDTARKAATIIAGRPSVHP